MKANTFEVLLDRRRVIEALRAHPEWSLAALVTVIEGGDSVLGAITVTELVRPPRSPSYVATRRVLAERLHGRDFDQLVLDVLETAWPAKVAASELRAQVGGPRWKLQASTERLVRRGLAARVGKTSDTRYSATSMGGVSDA